MRTEMNTENNVLESGSKTVHGVGEWAADSLGLWDGCSHDCRYCSPKAEKHN